MFLYCTALMFLYCTALVLPSPIGWVGRAGHWHLAILPSSPAGKWWRQLEDLSMQEQVTEGGGMEDTSDCWVSLDPGYHMMGENEDSKVLK